MTAVATTTRWSVNQQAAKAVALHARDTADARLLLDILGLVDGPHGREILPDDGRPVAVPTMGGGAQPEQPRRAIPEPPARNTTTPPGLRLLPPTPAPARTKKPAKRRSLTAELKELERTDPAVAAAARSLDETVERITSRPLPVPITADLDAAVVRRRQPAADPVAAETARLIGVGVDPDTAAAVAPIGARHRPLVDGDQPQPPKEPAPSAPRGRTAPARRSTPGLISTDLDAWFGAAGKATSPRVRRAARHAVAQLGLLRLAMDDLARAERAAATREAR